MTKDIENLIDNVNADLAFYLDMEVYIPLKEELAGVAEHSLGVRKELFKNFVGMELEKLKLAIREYIETNFESKE